MMSRLLLALLFPLCIFSTGLEAKEPLPVALKNVGIQEKIGQSISLDTTFKNENGQTVKIKDFFAQDRVVIVNFVYFNCPMLCNLVLTGLVDGLKKLNLPFGKKFEVVSISIDPTDTPATATEYKQKYLSLLGKKEAAEHWHFLTGTQDQITKITTEAGFAFKYDKETKEYSHGAGILFLTPEAKIARYLYGIEFSPFNLKMSILDASNRKMISSVERVLLFCYNFDAHKRGYVFYAINAMKIGAAVTLAVLAAFIIFLSLKYKTNFSRK